MRLEKIEALTEEKLLLHLADGSGLRGGPKEVLELGLRPGLELTEKKLAELREACEYWAVRRKAAALIAQRAMSAGELRRKLCQKGADPQLAERAAAWLTELGAVDEMAYAAMVVRHYAAKGYGRRRVEQELRRHELPRETWEEALKELPDSREQLDALVRRRLSGGPPDRAGLKKLADSLLRRGYGWEEVRAAIARNTDRADEDFD